MRIVNITNQTLNLFTSGLDNIQPLSISNEVSIGQDLIKDISTTLININQDNIVLVLTDLEKNMISGYGVILPFINVRNYSHIKVYNGVDDIPPGWKVVTDPYYKDSTGAIVPTKVLVQLPSNFGAPTEWEHMLGGSTKDLVRFKFGTWADFESIPVKNPNVIYYITDKHLVYRGDVNMNSVANIESLKAVLAEEFEDADASQEKVPTTKAVSVFITKKLESIVGGLKYAGTIDATDPMANPNWREARKGFYFRVVVEGTIDGIELGVGDSVIINEEILTVPTAPYMDVIPFTLDEIGDLTQLKTKSKDSVVNAINELKDEQTVWIGISK